MGPTSSNTKKENTFCEVLLRIFAEPMTILLLVASAIDFISGETGNGVFMAMAFCAYPSVLNLPVM